MGVFNKVSSDVKVRRSAFPFQQRLTYDCNMGELIPVFHRQVVPTDIFKMSNRVLVRFMPMFAPEEPHYDKTHYKLSSSCQSNTEEYQ